MKVESQDKNEIRTQNKNAMRRYHQATLDAIGESQGHLQPKMLMSFGSVLLFPSELKDRRDMFIEFSDADNLPTTTERKLWRYRHREDWETRYALYNISKPNDQRMVPMGDLEEVIPPVPVVKTDFPMVSIGDVTDLPFSEMTIRDFAAIVWGKGVSDKSWLNKLIIDNHG